jgi:soluble lytic murein transglycosylase
MQHILRTFVTLVCLIMVPASLAGDDPLSGDRARFLEARKALNENRLDEFRRLAGQLKDYPLYPYLEFQELRNRLKRAEPAEISTFIDRFSDIPLGWRLRRSWLYTLARQKNWPQFLQVYQPPQPVELRCYRLQAQLATAHELDKELADAAIQLWLVGKSQASACDPVFTYLYDNDLITAELRWAGYLAKQLPGKDQAQVNLWREAHRRPARILDSASLAQDTPMTREIILHALRRIARKDAAQAHRKWATLKSRYRFTAAEGAQLEKNIAMSAVWQGLPEAHDWLVAVPGEAVDTKVREWRIRTAIDAGNWPAVLEHIRAMPAEEAYREEWRYWQARALENTDQRLPAMDQFARLAKERDYHGFLAADFLRWPYEMGDRPLEYDQATLDNLANRPGFVRAKELYKAELLTDARREWEHAVRELSGDDLKLAAVLAHQWGWHDRAILTVARSGDYSDLELRFPLDYREDVQRHARQNRLDPAHVFAVIRQESAFNKDARSSAGAMGLMQLMPRTGRATARKNRIPLAGTSKLFEVEKNIRIGSAYLRQVMEKYNDNIVLASAAYNAGPHRVQRWLPEETGQSAASWIALIPFAETRKYVQRVLAYAAIYDWRMGRTVTPLRKHMPDVMPRTHYRNSS